MFSLIFEHFFPNKIKRMIFVAIFAQELTNEITHRFTMKKFFFCYWLLAIGC